MIKPLNGYVLVKKETVENKTSSGIIISVSEKEADNIAVVVAVSDGKVVDGKKMTPVVNVGQRIIFEKYSAHDVKYEGQDYLLIEEEKILAIIE